MSSRPNRTLPLVFGLSLFVVAGPAIPRDWAASPDAAPRAPCPRAAPLPFAPGEIVEIPDAGAPCKLEVRENRRSTASVGGGRLEARPGDSSW